MAPGMLRDPLRESEAARGDAHGEKRRREVRATSASTARIGCDNLSPRAVGTFVH